MKDQQQIFSYLFYLLLIGLPFSKALVSVAFVGLILFSLFRFFQKQNRSTLPIVLLLPSFLFLTLAISLLYSTNLSKGLKSLVSQIEFLIIPFIFWVNQSFINKKFDRYINVLIRATMIAAGITFCLFLLPSEWVQKIAEVIPLLKDFIVHEKELAFGVYSPFTERLQFSYLIGGTIFWQVWLLFETGKIGITLKIIPFLNLFILSITLLILGARGAQISFLLASAVWLIGAYFYWLYPILSKHVPTFFSYILLLFAISFLLFLGPYLAYKNIPAVKVRYDQLQWEIGAFQDGTFKNYDYTHFTSIRRSLSWKNSWSIIQSHPILGVGIGDYQTEMEQAYAKDQLGFPVNTQSQFLYYWTASGILGLLALLFLLGTTFFYFLKHQDLSLKYLGLSLVVFYILIFLFDAPLNFQVGAMTFLIFYCLLFIKSMSKDSMKEKRIKYKPWTTR